MKTVIQFKNIEQFETTRLSVRKIQLEDFDLVLPMYQNEKVKAELGGPITAESAKEKFLRGIAGWKNNGFGPWLWFEKQSQQLVARAGLRAFELEGKSVIDVGYILLPEFWNKGFATEIATASIEIGFEILNFSELIAFTSKTNTASQHVLEKVGFQFDHDFIFDSTPHIYYRLTKKGTL